MGPWYFSASAFSVIWRSWAPLSSEACVSLCAWWHRDNQILIFYLQNNHSECICWPNFLYPLHSPVFFTLCTPFFILYLPSPQGNPSFSSSPVPLPHPSFSPSPLFSNSGLTDWQYFISLQVYTIARQYFCTWHGYH